MNKSSEATKKTYQPPVLTKHQRLQKVTLGTLNKSPDWLQPGFGQ